MTSQDSQKNPSELQYLSKRVLVNGQFVTLYSTNGQTWLSSPEEIPELMARLENARIVLSNGEKPEEGNAQKPQKGEGASESPAPLKMAANKYRMKGPKPRPILKQDGVVIKGTPIEPISASTTVVTVSATESSASTKASVKSKKGAPVKSRESVKAAVMNAKSAAAAKTLKGKAEKAPIAAKSNPVAQMKKPVPVKASARVKAVAAKKVEPKVKAKLPAKPAVAKRPVAAKKKATPAKKAKSTRK